MALVAVAFWDMIHASGIIPSLIRLLPLTKKKLRKHVMQLLASIRLNGTSQPTERTLLSPRHSFLCMR